ncbi:MAG: nucleoside diphosphate kinase regulator [Candidatus Krumholzibacteria bacterium]|jgi:regulator of nucleoside diphosphate kinase|nr:nucleoside diphosphate kinase regulator [Candidatus Krumholzibacteria bacterium]
MARQIYITESDKRRLAKLVNGSMGQADPDRKDIEALAAELARANVVSSQDIPPDVVTMNSRVVLHDLDTAEEMTYILAFPQEADIDRGAISVLAPIGTAILGYAKGDVITWTVPSGIRRISIEDILYQPEAAGDHHM